MFPVFSGLTRTAYYHSLVERKHRSVHLSEVRNFRTGSPLSLPSGLFPASSLVGNTSPLLPPHPSHLGTNMGRACTTSFYTILRVSSVIGSCPSYPHYQGRGKHPQLLGYLLMRFKLNHLLNQHEGAPWTQTIHFRFPQRSPKYNQQQGTNWLLMDTGATYLVLKLIKCFGSIKTDMSLELLALNIKLWFSQGLLNVK